jgi:predicted transcriptional regulator
MNTATKTNTMTVRVSDELKAKLDRYAALTGRSMSYIAATAVEEYLAWRVPQLADLEQAIQEADAGKFSSKEEVEAIKKKWGYAGR